MEYNGNSEEKNYGAWKLSYYPRNVRLEITQSP